MNIQHFMCTLFSTSELFILINLFLYQFHIDLITISFWTVLISNEQSFSHCSFSVAVTLFGHLFIHPDLRMILSTFENQGFQLELH